MIKIIQLLFLVSMLSTHAYAQSASYLFQGPPVFHGAAQVGQRPNTEFVYAIPTTGERPIQFTVSGFPEGLQVDAQSGIIRGTAPAKGRYTINVSATNKQGNSQYAFTLICGDTLSYTPPMGWNSWNVFAKNIDEKLLLEIADAMVKNGMRDVGYQYINIDDYWHAEARDSAGNPVPDPVKFPNGIGYVAEQLHQRGLRLGIYSDAGTKTCGKCFGSYTYETTDANAYARWKVDLLKYDFCFVPWKKKEALSRYQAMGKALRQTDRSIVYSICNWGLFKPWQWAAEAGGQYWRTTPDIFDNWKGGNPFMMSVLKILKRQRGLEKYAGPGRWNDPDMLIVANNGTGNATSAKGIYKGLTRTQYQTHFALWCLLHSPLLASNDLRNMKEEDLAILTHPGLIQINQDALGQQAVYKGKTKGLWIYTKQGQHNQYVVVFNPSAATKSIPVSNVKRLAGATTFNPVKEVMQMQPIQQMPETITCEPHGIWIYALPK